METETRTAGSALAHLRWHGSTADERRAALAPATTARRRRAAERRAERNAEQTAEVPA